MSTGDVDDATSAKEAADPPRGLPCLVEFLARQATRVAHGSGEPMKERVVREPAEIVVGESSARGMRERHAPGIAAVARAGALPLHRLSVYFDSAHVHVTAGPMATARHQIGEADLIDLAQIYLIDPVADGDDASDVEFHPMQIRN